MAKTVIKVEGLGKCYRLGQERRERYVTLRDTFATSVHTLAGRTLGNGKKAARDSRKEAMRDMWAVREVTFNINEGEVVGIIGRNGAGKSTLLKLLSRVTEPTTGRLRMKGRLGTLLEVGTGFHPELTGRENIYMNGAICGLRKSEIDRKFDEIVAFSEVERSLDTPVKRYSSGMYLRLAFAVAAHLEAEILIVDEVLAVGDLQFQKKCIRKMEDVAGQGRTVLFVSHQLAAVQALCTRGLLMDGGSIVQDGTVESCIQTYIKMASSGEDDCQVSLDERVDRVGSGVARFTGCEVIHKPRTAALAGNSFMIGEPVGLRITLHSKERLSGVLIGFSVVDMRGTVLFTSHHTDALVCDNLPEGTTALESWVTPSHLLPGRYSIRLGLIAGGTAVDAIPDVISFEVEPAVGEGGRLPDGRPGLFQMDFPWTLLPAKPRDSSNLATAAQAALLAGETTIPIG